MKNRQKRAIQKGMFAFCMACFFLLEGCSAGKEQEPIVPERFADWQDADDLQQESAPKETVTVHLCGEVARPGVVTLPKGSRVADALELAGGFTQEAAADYVNLAAVLTDGEQILFPKRQEAEEKRQQEEMARQGKVNLNTATMEELMTLTGIGEARAKDILAYRNTNGSFARAEDLMQVPGIKESTFEKLKEKIYVD